jgi:plastocyanin
MRLCYGPLLAFLVACGSSSAPYGGGNPPPGPPPPPPPGTPVVGVSMTDNAGLAPYAFMPATITIAVGTVVKWTNNGKASHTTTSDATPQPTWNSGTVPPAGTTTCDPADPYCTPGTTPPGTYERAFTTAGTYPYHCSFHAAMTGTITVTP